MNKTNLSENEFEIINVIADGYRTNQRALSDKVGLSLGMTNLLLRRLVVKGYIRARQLNRKKIEYLLTPRGIAQKTQRGFHYVLKTIESFHIIREEIRSIMKSQSNEETRQVTVIGEGNFADFAWLVIKDYRSDKLNMTRVAFGQKVNVGKETLVLRVGPSNGDEISGDAKQIDLLNILSKRFPAPSGNGAIESKNSNQKNRGK